MSGEIRVARSKDNWFNNYISPGSVGSVGDCLAQVRVKRSYPDAPFGWDTTFSDYRESRCGSGVQDGQSSSPISGGMGAITFDTSWVGRQSHKTNLGWIHQDVSTPDKLVTPVDLPSPSYSWRNRVANVYNAKITGRNFLPLPGGFAPDPDSIPRSGLEPVITSIVGTEDTSEIEARVGYGYKNFNPQRFK